MQDLRDGLSALQKETGKAYLLTCAVGGGESFIENTEMDKVAKIVDYVNLMTYDLRGGFEDHAGHHTNLYPQTGDPDGPCGKRPSAFITRQAFPTGKWCSAQRFTAAAGRA